MPKHYIFVQVTSGHEYEEMLDLLDIQGYHWRSQSPMHDHNYWYTYENKGSVVFGIDPKKNEVWHDFVHHPLTIEEYRLRYCCAIPEDNIIAMDSVI